MGFWAVSLCCVQTHQLSAQPSIWRITSEVKGWIYPWFYIQMPSLLILAAINGCVTRERQTYCSVTEKIRAEPFEASVLICRNDANRTLFKVQHKPAQDSYGKTTQVKQTCLQPLAWGGLCCSTIFLRLLELTVKCAVQIPDIACLWRRFRYHVDFQELSSEH